MVDDEKPQIKFAITSLCINRNGERKRCCFGGKMCQQQYYSVRKSIFLLFKVLGENRAGEAVCVKNECGAKYDIN